MDSREPPQSFRSDSKLDHLRVPPQSIEAEQAVIGGLMLQPKAWDTVAEILKESDFYRRDHRLIFRGIQNFAEKNRPFDTVILGEWFEANAIADQIGGMSYLIDLASTTPSAANIKAYAEIVKDRSLCRQLIDAGTEIVNLGFSPDGRSGLDVVSHAITLTGNLMQAEPCELEDIRSVMKSMFQNLQERYEKGGGIDGLSTGYVELDKVLNGLQGGRVYVMASRPKMGKSTLATNIAEHVAIAEKKRVAIYSLEMPQQELAGRMTCSIGRIQHSRFRTAQLEDDDWSKVNTAIKAMGAAPIRISRPHNTRITSLIGQARRQHAKAPLGLIVIDYFQLIETDSHDNRTTGLTEVSRLIKMLAIDINVPIILLSQLNRALEQRPNKRPIPADLRETGALEQDADAVIFLYRDEVYNRQSRDKGTVEVDVALQRNGPSEMVRLQTRLDICRFENLPDDWQPLPAPEPKESTSKPRFRKSAGQDAAAGGDK